MIKRLKYIFIPVLAVFLMSHNVSAVDLSINLNDYENLNVSVSPDYYDFVVSGSGGVVRTCNKTYTCEVASGQSLRVAKTHKTYDLKVGDIVTYNIVVYSNAAIVENITWRALTPGGGAANFYFHKVSEFQGEGAASYFEVQDQDATSGLFDPASYNYSALYEVANIVTYNGNYSLGSYNQNTIDMTFVGGQDLSNLRLVVGISGFNVYRKKQTTVNQEQEQATQEAADDSSSAGDTSTSDAESATSSLLSVIGNGIGAITSATPTNCRINGNMGNLDMGSIDLCANPVPAFVAVIGSFIAVALVLPLVIILFNRFISIIRSFQN